MKTSDFFNYTVKNNFKFVSALRFFIPAVFIFSLLFFVNSAHAANCGNATSCACGDTVVASTTLTGNLNCTGHGLVIGADNITIDGNNFTVTGDGGSADYGLHNSGYGDIIIKNFSNITNFGRGIYFYHATSTVIQNSTTSSNGYGIYLSASASSTLTGNNITSNTNTGVYVLNSASTTLTNNVANSNTNFGINFGSSDANNLNNNIANSNDGSGIYLYSSDSNVLINNTANSNIGSGFFFSLSASSTLTGNTANSNAVSGIKFINSSFNIMSDNTMSSNIANLHISSDANAVSNFNHTIDTTNLVEGKPVYYLYNQSNQTYDGNVVGDIGMFWCISCTNITIKNATLSANNHYGIYFFNTSSSTIQNITASNFDSGIYLYSSASNTLINNTTNSNVNYGIYLSSSTTNILSGNVAKFNNYGVYIFSSASTTMLSNTILGNMNEIYDRSTSTYSGNQFLHNSTSNRVLTFTEATRTKSLNDTVSFDVSMFDANGNSCSDCDYEITTSPSETIISNKISNNITGSFTVTKLGTYSLNFTVTDSNNNVGKKSYLFFVGDTNSTNTRYYFRGISPTHGQPKGGTGHDAKSLLFSLPTSEENWYCGSWVQNSPDELPNYHLSILTGIDINSWYKVGVLPAKIGVQRFFTYDNSMDSSSSVSGITSYTWTNKNFTNLNWAMDNIKNWYWLALKFTGSQPYQKTTVAQPSYTDFTHTYTTTPTIKSISNDSINILSATTPANATKTATIVVDNPNSSATSTAITLDNFNYPFSGATTTIYSNATSVITTPLISAGATSSYSAVDMAVTPSAGNSVDVSINTWNTSGTYYKKWYEYSASPSATTTHAIGDLAANTYYAVSVASTTFGNYLSDASGTITFTYDGGYSEKTFEINGVGVTITESGASTGVTEAGATDTYSVVLDTQPTGDVTIALSLNNKNATTSVSSLTFSSSTWSAAQTVTVTASDNEIYEGSRATVISHTASSSDSGYNGISVNGVNVNITDNEVPYPSGFPNLVVSAASSSSSATSSAVSASATSSAATTSFDAPTPLDQKPVSQMTIEELQAKIAEITALISSLQTQLSQLSGNSISSVFTKGLNFGMQSDDVKRLQQLLATDKSVYPEGLITGYFGSLTQKAVQRFQLKYNIVASSFDPGFGYVGPKTRAKLNEVFSR